MSRIIELIVSPQGESKVTTKGFRGESCIQASKWLEQALGIVTTDHKTSEFFEVAKTEQHVQQ